MKDIDDFRRENQFNMPLPKSKPLPKPSDPETIVPAKFQHCLEYHIGLEQTSDRVPESRGIPDDK